MSAYLIVDTHVRERDSPERKRYAEEVPKTIEKYGGRYLVRAGKFEVLEGDWNPEILVVLEFPSMRALKRWYNSEEYRQILPLALKSTTRDLVAVNGL